jgi:RHS repeat-associated protein
MSAWRYHAESGQWQYQLAGDLAPLSNWLPTLSPSDALFVKSAAAADLETQDPTLRIRYYHQDHIGSSSVLTDATGVLVEETAYYPFGHPRNEFHPRQSRDPYQFTQKERDRESGLNYFGKRFYHPAIGKWLSTDPLEENGGGLNLYVYANDNPLKYTDPDGGEITVTPTFTGKGRNAKITHYEIHVTAVVINLSPKLKAAGYDKAKVEQFANTLKATVEKSYSSPPGKKEGNVTWHTTVDIKVIDDVSQIKQGEHVFRLVDRTYDGSRGLSTRGGLWMEIKADTFLAARPAKEGSVKDYLSPESTGAHELGHTGGLDHWFKGTPNLMQEGNKREYDTKTIAFEQIKKMYEESQAGNLNKGSSKIGSWEYAHLPKEERDK